MKGKRIRTRYERKMDGTMKSNEKGSVVVHI